MAGKKGNMDITIKAFLGLKQDRKVFVSGFVYGELGLNSFGIVDKTGHIEVQFDATYKKSKNPASYGKSVRIYAGELKEKKMILTSRSSMFVTSNVEHKDPPSFEFKIEGCLERVTQEPGIVSFLRFYCPLG